jgi:hypothetical protein
MNPKILETRPKVSVVMPRRVRMERQDTKGTEVSVAQGPFWVMATSCLRFTCRSKTESQNPEKIKGTGVEGTIKGFHKAPRCCPSADGRGGDG